MGLTPGRGRLRGMRCCGAAPPTAGAWDRNPPWGRPLGQLGGAGGGSPPRRPGPMPPAAPPHSSASEPGWTPASAGGPSGGAGRGPGPPGRGADGGAPPLPRVLGAPCPPTRPLGRPQPAPADAGGRGGTAGGRHRALTAAPSCPFSAARQMCGGRAARVALCCVPLRAVPWHAVRPAAPARPRQRRRWPAGKGPRRGRKLCRLRGWGQRARPPGSPPGWWPTPPSSAAGKGLAGAGPRGLTDGRMDG